MDNKLRKPAITLLITLLVGSLYAFTTVFFEFIEFYFNEGTIFKVNDCITPNPVTTACFYGAFGFLISFIWAYRINNYQVVTNKINQYFYLNLLLIGCTIFAWYNNYSTMYTYFFDNKEIFIGCTGKLIQNPFTTPCFIGASIFTVALLISTYILVKIKRI